MEKENDENLDSPKEETDQTENLETAPEETQEETFAETEDVELLKEKNRQLFARAKKAEAEAKAFKFKPQPKPEAKKEPISVDEDKVSKLVDAQLEKRELESLDLSDKLRKEVKTYSKVNNVSVAKALKSDYIQFLKEKEERDLRNDGASLGISRKSSKKDYGSINPLDLDLRTPEGQAAHAKWEEAIRKQLG